MNPFFANPFFQEWVLFITVTLSNNIRCQTPQSGIIIRFNMS